LCLGTHPEYLCRRRCLHCGPGAVELRWSLFPHALRIQLHSVYAALVRHRSLPSSGEGGELMAINTREQLLTLLAEKSFRLGQFTLSSGGTSDYYVDCRLTTLDAHGALLTGETVLQEIHSR